MAQAASKDQEEVVLLEQYWDYKDIFSEKGADWFPPKRFKDHHIQLKEGALEELKIRVYTLSWEERKVVKEYFQKNLEQGFIESSKSP